MILIDNDMDAKADRDIDDEATLLDYANEPTQLLPSVPPLHRLNYTTIDESSSPSTQPLTVPTLITANAYGSKRRQQLLAIVMMIHIRSEVVVHGSFLCSFHC
jgi:hypothetical protein